MSDFKYFDRDDFVCKETGNNEIKDKFIHRLDTLREICGFPFIVTSGYRDPSHSAERNKPNGGGTHTKGIAADIAVWLCRYWLFEPCTLQCDSLFPVGEVQFQVARRAVRVCTLWSTHRDTLAIGTRDRDAQSRAVVSCKKQGPQTGYYVVL